MGAMACNRNGCDHVMCNYHSDAFGYICYDCMNELIRTKGNMTIAQFMNSPKHKEYNDDPYAWGSYVERIFEEIE